MGVLQPHKSFVVDTGKMTLALAQNAKFVISNPANSGKAIIVDAFVVSTTASALQYAAFFKNPTSGLPTQALVPRSMIIGAPGEPEAESAAVVKAGTGTAAMAAGDGQLLTTTPLKNGDRTVYDEKPVVIQPGASFGINVAATVAADLLIGAYYREESI